MIFAILFVIAFAIGLVAYLATGKWLSAALVSVSLFALNAILSSTSGKQLWITLLLGLPVVFAASIFGAYVVELRRGPDESELESGAELDTQVTEDDSASKQ